MRFHDRNEAGRELAKRLLADPALAGPDARPVVLALPRGGVPVGWEIAKALKAPLDIVLVRKIGVPCQPELALGAIVDGETPELVINEDVKSSVEASEAYIEAESAEQLREIERRRAFYLSGRPPVPVRGCTAILVDDGIATGATMRAALRATRRRGPAKIVLAVPVAPPESIEELKPEADQVICLHAPWGFAGVGQFYADFHQVSDATVAALLQERS